MIKKSPLVGLGVNTYARNIPFYQDEEDPNQMYAHNGYLQMAAEIGCLGLLSFVVIFIYALMTGLFCFVRASDPWIKAAGVALVFGIFSFLLHSATDTNLHAVLLIHLLWLALGILIAAKKLSREPLS